MYCPPNCSIGFQIAVYDLSGRKSHGNLMVGCAETIVNIDVFVRFRFFQVFCKLDDFELTFSSFWSPFLGSWEHWFVHCEVLGLRSKTIDF